MDYIKVKQVAFGLFISKLTKLSCDVVGQLVGA